MEDEAEDARVLMKSLCEVEMLEDKTKMKGNVLVDVVALFEWRFELMEVRMED